MKNEHMKRHWLPVPSGRLLPTAQPGSGPGLERSLVNDNMVETGTGEIVDKLHSNVITMFLDDGTNAKGHGRAPKHKMIIYSYKQYFRYLTKSVINSEKPINFGCPYYITKLSTM